MVQMVKRGAWAVAMGLVLSACGGGGGGGDAGAGAGGSGTPGGTGSAGVQFVLGVVENGSCSIFNGATRIAGPVNTTGGVASFTGLTATSGLVQLLCENGVYVDEATGKTMTAPRLRNYVQVTGGALTASVSPVTELAVRLLGNRDATANFPGVLKNVAESLGLKDVPVGATQATDLNTTNAADTAAGRYGVALAGLSQLQANGPAGTSVNAVLDKLAAGFGPDGMVKDIKVREDYAAALEDLLDNARLKTRVGGETGALATVYTNLADEDLTVVIDYIETDTSLLRDADAPLRVQAGQPSVVRIVGSNLDLGISVTFGGVACRVNDLQPLETSEIQSASDKVDADCPARPAGATRFVVADKGVTLFEDTIDVTNDDLQAEQNAKLARLRPNEGSVFGRVVTKGDPRRQATTVEPAAGVVTGKVQADAPTIAADGSLSYASLRTFDVKGVVVELLDRAANDAVLATSFTNDSGIYSFAGVPAGRNVVVRVKAQVAKTRAAGVTTGPQYNFMMRDNTVAGSVKPLYTLDSAATTTADGGTVVNVKAALGFDATGTANGPRQSAPFSILEVVNAAAINIEKTDANVVMPDLNIYWSTNNVDAEGNKEIGQIGTSHYAASGKMPGVYILGKADVDTDEFDQGVIGHEFGHYLQEQLSYSDSQGGSHSNNEFKDASLAYGEGYGTAVGGLLSGSPFYTDSKGAKQGGGSATDLRKTTVANEARGFYAEGSVQTVMYRMGVQYGFTPFWKAIVALRGGHESATVFSFLSTFVQQNPALEADVRALAATENIRTLNALGELPAGTTADPAINATASKGASDLEALYIKVNLAAANAGTDPVNLTTSATPFCVNRNLKGANLSNGLGLTKRFTFTANFTGNLGVRAVDDKGKLFDDQSTALQARDNTGTKADALNWANGNGMIPVVSGRVYTVQVRLSEPANVFMGNRCGNQVSFWRMPADS